MLLIGSLPELQERAVFIPIPLHPRRQRERGFNQSALIAQQLSADTGIPLLEALMRHRSTWVQSNLPTELRAVNIKDSFQIAPEFELPAFSQRHLVILVDDVATSGSTLRAAAQALNVKRGQQLWGLTVARG
jgi:ComF family protein